MYLITTYQIKIDSILWLVYNICLLHVLYIQIANITMQSLAEVVHD